ncbi:MAG: HNH endonuclease [Chloroflexi bacterium]|nr:HNH endonuclease [Chloroflexota bacterium]
MAHVPTRLEQSVREAFQGNCAYCQSRELLMGVTFEIEHIIPRSKGGQTTVENLCLACPTCNRHKASRLNASDPLTGQTAPLFHPLTNTWKEHFRWNTDETTLLSTVAQVLMGKQAKFPRKSAETPIRINAIVLSSVVSSVLQRKCSSHVFVRG